MHIKFDIRCMQLHKTRLVHDIGQIFEGKPISGGVISFEAVRDSERKLNLENKAIEAYNEVLGRNPVILCSSQRTCMLQNSSSPIISLLLKSVCTPSRSSRVRNSLSSMAVDSSELDSWHSLYISIARLAAFFLLLSKLVRNVLALPRLCFLWVTCFS